MPKPYSRNKLNLNSLEYLSRRLGFPVEELDTVAEKSASYYKFDKVPKKSGGYRDISKPFPRLKRIQSSIHNLLTELKVSDSAHGGIKGRSNLTNAKVHCNSLQVIKFDIKNFFPTISHNRVYNLFHRSLGCSPSVSSILTKLSTVKGQVPQGGPMSTDIANLVLREADKRFEGMAKKLRLRNKKKIIWNYFFVFSLGKVYNSMKDLLHDILYLAFSNHLLMP